MKIGDRVRLRYNDVSTDQKFWEVIGFYKACGESFIKLKHPTIVGTFSFPKNIVVEVLCK